MKIIKNARDHILKFKENHKIEKILLTLGIVFSSIFITGSSVNAYTVKDKEYKYCFILLKNDKETEFYYYNSATFKEGSYGGKPVLNISFVGDAIYNSADGWFDATTANVGVAEVNNSNASFRYETNDTTLLDRINSMGFYAALLVEPVIRPEVVAEIPGKIVADGGKILPVGLAIFSAGLLIFLVRRSIRLAV